jgi:hypothetical protein
MKTLLTKLFESALKHPEIVEIVVKAIRGHLSKPAQPKE